MAPSVWLALCRREMLELARGFSPITRILRYLLSLGVFLPWIAERLPWTGAGLLFESYQILLLGAGSAQFAVWAHETAARDLSNREILSATGVSSLRSLAARVTVGTAMAIFTGTTALVCLHFLAPFARYSSAAALRSGLFLTAGLILSLACSLWAAAKFRPPTQSIPAILFSLLAVWLGFPVAGGFGREWAGFPVWTGVFDPVGLVTSRTTGILPVAIGLAWLLFLSFGFLLAAIPRVQRVQDTTGRRSSTGRLDRFVLGNLMDEPHEAMRPYFRRLAPLLPDAVGYLKQAAGFFAVAINGVLLQSSSPGWFWIAFSALVLGHMFYGAWMWHTCVSVNEEDRRIGDVATCIDRSDPMRRATQQWLGHVTRWSRWTMIALYLVFSLAAWRGDADFPWVLFAVLTATLSMMPSYLGLGARTLADESSTALRHLTGITALIVWPLWLGAILGGAAGAKGFLAGTALGVVLADVMLVTLGMLAGSLLGLRARLGFLYWNHQFLQPLVSRLCGSCGAGGRATP